MFWSLCFGFWLSSPVNPSLEHCLQLFFFFFFKLSRPLLKDLLFTPTSCQVMVLYTAQGTYKRWHDRTAEKGKGESGAGLQIPKICICRDNCVKFIWLPISCSIKKSCACMTWLNLLWLILVFFSSISMRCILTKKKKYEVCTRWWSSDVSHLQLAWFSPGLSFLGKASVRPCMKCIQSVQGWKPWPWSQRLTWRAMTTFQYLNLISSHDSFR